MRVLFFRDYEISGLGPAAAGVVRAEEAQEMQGVGRFGWVTDPEGNRIELWQPA